MKLVDYYFSLTSPWSYMGNARFAMIAAKHGADVVLKPAKLGVVFEQTGGLPLPKRAPARQAYRLAELRRWSEHLQMPFVIEPDHFPYDDTEASRLVLAAQETGADALALVTELGRALWERNENPADTDVQDAAAERAGVNADALRAALSVEEAEKIRDANTHEAIARGVFGAPSYVIGGEIFWGQDRLDFVDRKLAG